MAADVQVPRRRQYREILLQNSKIIINTCTFGRHMVSYILEKQKRI